MTHKIYLDGEHTYHYDLLHSIAEIVVSRANHETQKFSLEGIFSTCLTDIDIANNKPVVAYTQAFCRIANKPLIQWKITQFTYMPHMT